MGQDATFEDKFNFIEAEGHVVHQEVKLWIEATNVNKDVAQVLGKLEQTSFPFKFGYGIFHGRASTLWK